MLILALDVGTSAVKAAVLNAVSTEAVAEPVHESYPLDRPDRDTATVPAQRLWDAVHQAANQAVADAKAKIDGVGLSCMTPALVLLDRNDEPIAPIWTHFDRRSRPLAQMLASDAERCAQFLEHACNPPLPGGLSAFSAARQLQLEPGLRGRVRSYLHANGWLALKLTGERAIDTAGACFTGLYEPRQQKSWSQEWCGYFGIEPDWLPNVVCGSTTLGGLRPEIAAAWKLSAGIPVKIGTADTSSAMLAAGMRPGDLLHVVGTTQVLAAFADPPRPQMRRLCRPLGVGDAFIHVTHNPVGGEALAWLFSLCYDSPQFSESERETARQHFFDTVVKQDALKHETEVRLDPPFLGGDRLEIADRSAAFGNLKLATSKIDLVAAVLDGMRRGHTQAHTNLGLGSNWRRIFLTGGGADVVERLQLAEYNGAELHTLKEGSLRGVARLFVGAE